MRATLKIKPLVSQVAAVAFVAFLGVVVIESLWWRNALDSYPQYLISKAPESAKDLIALRDTCGDPLEIAPYSGDMALVRCGMYWPMRTIWLVPRANVAPAINASTN